MLKRKFQKFRDRKLEGFNFDANIFADFFRCLKETGQEKKTVPVPAVKKKRSQFSLPSLPPSLPPKKIIRSPRLQDAQDSEVGDKVLIFSSRDTEVIRASSSRQHPRSRSPGKMPVMVRKSCDNQLRYRV